MDDLLTYQDLRRALGGKRPLSLRQVQRIVGRHRSIIRPVELGYRTVRFRPARVQALISHLAGDAPVGGRYL